MPPTKSGFQFGEVSSSFQKSVRRGLVDDALYWGVELWLSGYEEYAWKRMKVMCSEDIGIANPNLPSVIHALYTNHVEQKRKRDDKHPSERLFFVHAIILLAQSPKCRIVDNANMYHFTDHDKARREVPDYAFDKHTGKGRAMKRGFQHFFDVGAHLENKAAIPDPYEQLAREAKLGGNYHDAEIEDEATLF
jgi:replication-associated recombination protein RarA